MKQFDAVVVGAGPGGYVCAIRLAQLGKKTAIIEKQYFGGVCLNVGCIPSKALIHAADFYWKMKNETGGMGISASAVDLDLEKMQAWKNGIVKKLSTGVSSLLKMNGVESIKGIAQFKDAKTIEVITPNGRELVTADAFVIATGSRSVELRGVAFNGKNIISSTEALDLKLLPKKLVVIGGGFIGLEIGFVYAKLGSQVTVVEALDQILPNTDKELISPVEKRMKKLGMNVYVKAKALGLKEKNPAENSLLHLDIETVEGQRTLEADAILVSVGRRPNTDGMGLEDLGIKLDTKKFIPTDQACLTNIPGIYAIGDVTAGPLLAHRASMDGLIVAASIAGERSFKDYKTVPWAVFSDPEIAACGLTEKELQEKGIKYRAGKFPFAANARSLTLNSTEGLVKVLIDEGSDAVLGVHIVGPEASSLIAEAALAIEMGATAEDIMRTIHTHPTLPEVFPEAFEAAYSKAIHIFKPERERR
ncbi:MAG: dihydrolipoyl dehydrogenase [Deltaproteobacteria bacterium]|nr:dihydrolipoyl dehydrogenase [Deltaproteobacteria bacterium]